MLYFLPAYPSTVPATENAVSNGIDISCNQALDCQIKNVGNQCGYYPMCVNKVFLPNPPELNSMICGFPSIKECRCIKNKCEGF